jgi:molecular chaperone Hsp33
MHDHLIRAIARMANVRVASTVTTGVVTDGARRHQLSPVATCAVGRALTSGLLLATLTKGGERVTVQLSGDGPIGTITVDATDAGDVRGYAARPDAGPALAAPTERCMVAQTLGRNGVVNVLRDLGLRELYQGQVALTSGEIDEDLEAYLRTSEQVPSALGCEVVLRPDGSVLAAAGVLVQAMPGGDPDAVLEAQEALRAGRLHELLRSGECTAAALAKQIYASEPLEIVGDERSVRFACKCSPERIGEVLTLLGTADLDEMIAENKPAEITCNYCGQRYHVDRSQLERIRSQVAGGPRQSN